MLGWNRLLAKFRNLLRPSNAEIELEREIESHVALIKEQFERDGMPEHAAELAARREYGNVGFVKESHREERSFVWFEQATQDIRYALRGFSRSKVFTATAILTLAMGIGANTIIFSIVNTLLLHPLPYPRSHELVALSTNWPTSGVTIVSFTKFSAIQEQSSTLKRTAAYYFSPVNLTTRGNPEQVPAARASFDFFPILSVTPSLGRGFLKQEDQPGGQDVAIVTDSFWRSHLNGDADAIGKSIPIDGRNATVIGVLPPDFRFPFLVPEPQIWEPRVFENPNYPPERIRAGVAYLLLIGDRVAGQPLSRIQKEIDTICARYRRDFPNFPDSAYNLSVETLEGSLISGVRASLLALLGAVGFLLLIACTNVASMLTARATHREHELSIRRSLGAGQGRLIRQLLTESLVLSFLGGVIGVGAGVLLLRPLLNLVHPGTLPGSDVVTADSAVMLLSVAVCFVTGVIFGLIPAWTASKSGLSEKLRQGGRNMIGGRRRVREAMVVLEVALTMMLMTGAGLLVKSLNNLLHVDLGFTPGGVSTFFLNLPASLYPRPDQRREFSRALIEKAAAIPGADSVAIVSHLPLSGGARFVHICPEGTVCQGFAKDPITAWRQVSPGFFRTMRTTLLRGRIFDDRDRADSMPVVIINGTIANRFFAGINPLGRHITNSRDGSSMEIIGVVADTKYNAVNRPNAEEMYVPYTQNPWPSMTLVVRSRQASAGVVSAVRSVVSQLNPDIPLAQIRSMDDYVASSIAQPKLVAWLAAAFAGIALFLATVGIYGVMAYSVTQRSAEIAIRMALGARRWTVCRLIIGHGMALVAAGLAIGLVLAMSTGQMLSSLLYGTRPRDFGTLATGCIVFGLVAFVACYIPSRRASRQDPLVALRNT